MGENAIYRGRQVKIGTCENMYYLRADQVHMVTPAQYSVDPVRHRDSLRFRFPFPDEDRIEPGHFADFDRGLTVAGASVPDGVDHYRDGCAGDVVAIVQQRYWEGRLVLVGRCEGCGARYRLPDLDDVQPVLDALDAQADRELIPWAPGNREAEARAVFLRSVADRAAAGYSADIPALTG